MYAAYYIDIVGYGQGIYILTRQCRTRLCSILKELIPVILLRFALLHAITLSFYTNCYPVVMGTAAQAKGAATFFFFTAQPISFSRNTKFGVKAVYVGWTSREGKGFFLGFCYAIYSH